MADTVLNKVSGIWKYTRRKIGKFSRTSRSVTFQNACKYLKSIRFHKCYTRDLYRLWPTDQNSSNFIHLCINSIYRNLPKAESWINHTEMFLKKLLANPVVFRWTVALFFPAKFPRNFLFQNLFLIILQPVDL